LLFGSQAGGDAFLERDWFSVMQDQDCTRQPSRLSIENGAGTSGNARISMGYNAIVV